METIESVGWWGSAGAFVETYWWIGIIATAILAVLLIINFFAGGDADFDGDIDADGGMGFQFLTFKNLIAFFAVFGWTGMVCIDGGLSNGTTVIVSFIAGLSIMVLLGLMFYMMSRVTQSGTLIVKKAIGGIGETYIIIPSKRTGFGKVQIRVQGSLRELDAVTDGEEDIQTGKLVTVVDVINDEILVVKENK